jgi:hypothetical protein
MTIYIAAGVLAAAAGLTGCGDDDGDPMSTTDLGVETGTTPLDMGPTPNDMGVTPEDMGVVPGDMGSTPIDMGVAPEDMGSTPIDMGMPRTCVTATSTTSRVTVPASITTNTTWTCDRVYELTDFTWVEGATLTIEPGTTVVGRAGTRAALLVSRTGRLEAAGTPERPILFTSSNALPGSTTPPVAGDWGGVALLGAAENNLIRLDTSVTPPVPTTERILGSLEGINPAEFGDKALYGATSAATANPRHDCGTLTYAVIEYAGYEYTMGNELNGLTVAACGSDTTLHHIMVTFGKDDGIEFFGGNANLHHAIIVAPGDDFLDYDEGYVGKIQFVVAQGRDVPGEERAIEADNLEENHSALPRTQPTIFNATFIGSGRSNSTGPYFRRGAGTVLRNFISQGHARECLRVDGSATEAQLTSAMPTLVLTNGLVGDCGGMPLRSQTMAGADVLMMNVAVAGAGGTGVNLAAARHATEPDFAPAPGSAAATAAAATPPSDGFFDTTATYLGAVAPGTPAASAWYRASWTRWRLD